MKLTTKLLQDSKDATSKSATAAVSDKKSDDDSAVKDKSSSAGWGAKKSFADILKEKRAAAAKMSQGSSDESSPKVSEFEDSAPTPFSFFFLQGKVFKPSSCFPSHMRLVALILLFVSSELLISNYGGKSRHPER